MDKPDKKILLNNLKISIFSKDKDKIYTYISEFIFIYQIEFLLENILVFWLEFFINLDYINIFKFNNCLNFIETTNKKEIYLINKNVVLYDFIDEFSKLKKNNVISELYYKKNKEVKLEYNSEIISKNFNEIHFKLLNYIQTYIPKELNNYFIELLFYFFTQNKIKFFNLLNTIINKFSKNKKLIKFIETIHSDFKDNLLILLINISKVINILIYNNNKLFEEYYNIIEKIFNWNLRKNNIKLRINLIFILYDVLFDIENVIKFNKDVLIKIKNSENELEEYIDYEKNNDINKLKLINCFGNNINYKIIYENHIKLINLYNLKIKKQVNKKKSINNVNSMNKNFSNNSNNSNNSDNSTKSNINEKTIEELSEYLYTIININNEKYQDKNNKINHNRFLLRQNCSKSIDIDCNENIFSSFSDNKNSLNIVKLNRII